jgi:hypothetical protein
MIANINICVQYRKKNFILMNWLEKQVDNNRISKLSGLLTIITHKQKLRYL